MKKLALVLVAGLMSTFAMAEPEDGTVIYRAYAPTVEQAQVVLDGINNNSIKVCKFGGQYDTTQKAYSVSFPASATYPHVNKNGQIEMRPAKTTFKVKCTYRD